MGHNEENQQKEFVCDGDFQGCSCEDQRWWKQEDDHDPCREERGPSQQSQQESVCQAGRQR